jgi:predicted enzyme related to lactoylglutathione lyase
VQAVAHYSSLRVIVLDVPGGDHDRTVAFWQGAIGSPLTRSERHPEYHWARLPHHQHLGLLVQHLGDGPARVHLDIHTDDVAAEVARLETLGAARERAAGEWQVMRDPAGLLFCVVPERPGSLTDDNAQRWD